MVIRELLDEAVKTLKNAENENPIFEAHLTIRTVLNLSALDIVLKVKDEVSKKDVDAVRKILTRRISGEPLQYILGTQEFMGLNFSVNPSVLIPRADTEILTEYVLSYFAGKPFSALDLCTGSGCIAISLAHFNKNAHIKGIDVSEGAIKTAQKNAEDLEVSDRVSFERADIFKLDSFGKFDLVISNPPYIESNVIPNLSDTVNSFEPHLALDGGADGLKFYRHIVKIAPKYLRNGGMLAFEIGFDQKHAVSELMKDSFTDITSLKDYSSNDRVVSGILK